MTHSTGQSPVAVAETAERQADAGNPDPFPPEGTDEKLVDPGTAPSVLKESDRVRATQAAIASEGKSTLETP